MAGKAWYALRRTLPKWSVDRNLEELVEYCKQNYVDEIIVKVDSEDFTHGIPSIEWVDDYLPNLKRIKSRLNEIGVVFSLNPWVTLVHCDRGRQLHETYPDIDLMVGHDGTKCSACACPLSEGWKKVTRELWHRYAALGPDVLWVEDDIRLHNHQPAKFGCFCPLHMKEFSEIVGKDVSREELVEALLAPGEPHPYRKAWLDMNRDIMNETVAFIEGCVHEISPEIKLGLMCSLPTSHAIEGRDWDSFTTALAGEQTLVARPCLGNYIEVSPRGLYYSDAFMKVILNCLKPDTIIQTEVENWCFTGFSKSAKFTFLQCALSFLLGADGVTMNLYDHMGTPMSIDPGMGKMLHDKKAYLNAINERCLKGSISGIQLLHPQTGSYNVHAKEDADIYDLSAAGHAWGHILGPLGFPTTFEKSNVVALSGQVVRSLSKERITEILSGGVLVDLGALKCLIDAGFEDMLGVSIKRTIFKYDEPLAAEEYFNTDFGGAKDKYLTNTLPHLGGNPEMADMALAKETVVVSHLVDPDVHVKYPFLTLYENKLGGRVAVYPIDIEYMITGISFLNPYRKEQMDNVVEWLSRGDIALKVTSGPYPLAVRIDKDGRIVLGVFNLTLDDWPSVTFDLTPGREITGRVEVLQEDGTWREDESFIVSQSGNRVQIERSTPVDALSLIVLSLS